MVHGHDHETFGHWSEHEDKQITAMLLKFKSRYTAMMTVRRINEGSSLQAALPVFELDRLMQLIGNASDVLVGHIRALPETAVALLSL